MERGSFSTGHQVAAWCVHLLTGLGALFALLAAVAVFEKRWIAALEWLAVALLVDGIDGPLARAIQVTRVLPHIDGNLLDLIVDYFTFVIVPSFFLLKSGLLAEPFQLPGAAMILLTSQYHYARKDLKTADNYFQGFPAFWNIVIFYLYVLDLRPWVNLALVALFSVLTLTSTKWVHPVRVKTLLPVTLFVTAIWCVSSAVVLVSLPARNGWGIAISSLAVLYIVALGVVRTVRGPLPARGP